MIWYTVLLTHIILSLAMVLNSIDVAHFWLAVLWHSFAIAEVYHSLAEVHHYFNKVHYSFVTVTNLQGMLNYYLSMIQHSGSMHSLLFCAKHHYFALLYHSLLWCTIPDSGTEFHWFSTLLRAVLQYSLTKKYMLPTSLIFSI